MTQKIFIQQYVNHPNSIELILKENISLENCKAVGQMLVDSANFSFIYIVEKDGEYTYLSLDESIWPALKDAMQHNKIIVAVSGEEKLELISFQEELSYLLETIRGNSNYGEEMVQKVDHLF